MNRQKFMKCENIESGEAMGESNMLHRQTSSTSVAEIAKTDGGDNVATMWDMEDAMSYQPIDQVGGKPASQDEFAPSPDRCSCGWMALFWFDSELRRRCGVCAPPSIDPRIGRIAKSVKRQLDAMNRHREAIRHRRCADKREMGCVGGSQKPKHAAPRLKCQER